jgi:hypothetical protein
MFQSSVWQYDTKSYPSLLNKAVNSSDYIMPNGRMVTEQKLGKILKEEIGA